MEIVKDTAFATRCDAARQTTEYADEKAAIDAEIQDERDMADALAREPAFSAGTYDGFVRFSPKYEAFACFVVGRDGKPICVATHVPNIGKAMRLLHTVHGISRKRVSLCYSHVAKHMREKKRKTFEVYSGGVPMQQMDNLRRAVARTDKAIRVLTAYADDLPHFDWYAPETLVPNLNALVADLTALSDRTAKDVADIEAKIEKFKKALGDA